MSTVAVLFRHDLRLQYRYRIHAAYGVVVALYAVTLMAAGPLMPDWLVALLIYSDPSALGFFFLGGLMLLEKGEGARAALAISPASAWAYLVSKTATLTGLALIAVAVLGVAKPGPVHWPLLLVAVALTSVFNVALGVGLALRFRTVSGYLLGSAALLLPLFLPALAALIDPMPIGLALVPPVAQFRLVLVSLGAVTAGPGDTALMIAIAAFAAGMAAMLGARLLAVELGRK